MSEHQLDTLKAYHKKRNLQDLSQGSPIQIIAVEDSL